MSTLASAAIDFAAAADEDSPLRRSLYRRYREKIDARESWNDALSTILSHRSVRSFLTDPLPAGTLELLVAAAQSAPSSSNLQVWSVVAVEDPARKARLAEFAGAQRQIVEAPLFLVFVADLARLQAIAEDRGGATLAGLDYLEGFVLGVVDASLAAQNAVVAAESIGLGTVYIGAIRNHPDEVARELVLPPRSVPVFGLCVGRPDPAVVTDVKPRLPQAAVLHRERYSRAAQQEPIKRYDVHSAAFRREQKLAPIDWTRQVIERLKTVDALKGRHRLREIFARLGFALR
ncbi:MAG TPA: NADPH-dependent oxidoreductase [Xanthobacteraceae bacterium]|nr:NADPH-dependent oxidoreductase [Xanthobacteraceae bacterium]